MKNFFKKHIFSPPTHFDANTVFIMICGLAVIFSPIISCGPSEYELEARQKKNIEINDLESSNENNSHDYDDIEIREIDSCEYIVYRKPDAGGWSSGICHKANCKNQFHQK